MTLISCSTIPQEIPDCAIPGPSPTIQSQLPLMDLPTPVGFTEQPQTATFDRDGMEEIKRLHITAQTNSDIAQNNAQALEARNAEVVALIECARYQNVWIQVHSEDLKLEKQGRFKDNLVYQTIIGIGILGVVL